MKRWRLAILACFAAMVLSRASAQSDTDLTLGLQQNSSYHGGDVDLVNLGTGNLMLKIPLVSYPQRGSALKLEYDYVYNGGSIADRYWCPAPPPGEGTAAPPPDPSLCIQSWHAPPFPQPRRPPWMLSDMQNVTTGVLVHSVTPTYQQYSSQEYTYAYASFQTGDGAIHVGEPASSGVTQRSVDGTGFVTNLDLNYMMTGNSPCTANCFTRDMNGISYYPNGIPGSVLFPSSTPSGQSYVIRQDSAGNQITSSADGTTITDTVGRQITPSAGLPDASACGSDLQLPVTGAEVWTVPGPTSVSGNGDNGTLKYIFCYTRAEVFIPGGVNELQEDSSDLRLYLPELERIILPNGQKWTFEYDSSDGPNPSFGDLTKITLPTGGTITYTYEFAPRLGGTGRSVASRTVDAHDGKGPQTWTYSGGYMSITGDGPFTTTVTGPPTVPGQPGDDTVHTFMSDGVPIETNVTQYQGPAANGHVLQNTATVYAPTYGSAYSGGIFTQGYFPQTITTTTDGVVTSQKAYQYCCDFNTLEGTKTYGLVSDVKSYDYGSGGPGGLLKEESTTYVFQSNSQYANDNMLSYVASKTVTGGGITAQTTYSYDEPTYITAAPNGVPSFGTPNTANPGFETTATRTVSGTSSVSTHSRFYNTGEIYQQIDARGTTAATYSYSPTYGYALPTQITNALGQPNTIVYDPNTGQKTSSMDPNSQTTTWSYDSTGRPSGISYPDGGWISYCYNDAPNTCPGSTGAVNSILITKAENLSQNLQEEVDVDALGRKIRTIVSEGGGVYLYTDTIYDVLGRVQSVSNPYHSTGDATYGTTQYTYDALARKVQQIDPDSHSVWWCYDGVQTLGQPNCASNAISGTIASWVDMTDKEGKHWQHLSDGLGRLTGVVEPDPTTGALALKTQYGYDGLGDLLSVNQTGNWNETARTRNFHYDSLGRLTDSSNPETGGISYSYLSGGSFCAGDVTLPCSRTDARGVITNYFYDSLDRLTSKSYVNSNTPSVSYGYDSSTVNGALNVVGRLTSETVSVNGQVLSQRLPYVYDGVGRVKELLECTTANCSGNPYHLAYQYDYDGNVVKSTNGIPNAAFSGDPADLTPQYGSTTTTFNGITVPSVLLTAGFDNVGRQNALTSSWSDAVNHPATLFQASSPGAYSPAGLANAVLGYNSLTNQTTVNLARTYDSSMRVLSESNTSSNFISTPATPGSGTITISGTEGQQNVAATPATGSVRIVGVEGRNIVCESRCTTVYDTGGVSITVGNFTASAGYGQGSTSSTIAAALAAALNQPGSPVTATAAGSAVTIQSIGTGAGSNYSYSATSGDDFSATASGGTLVGGANSYTGPDTGQMSVVLNGTTFSVPWSGADNLQTVTASLANTIQSGGVFVTSYTPGSIHVQTAATGVATNGAATCSTTDTVSPTSTPSFSLSCTGLTGGADAYSGPKQLYSYAIPSSGGYTWDGNIASVSDSVTGSWSYTYDQLNRLSTAAASSGTYLGSSIMGATLGWTYDSFGNRLTQNSNIGLFPTGSVQFPGTDNRATGTGLISSPTVSQDTLQYDLSGNLTGKDGNTTTAYDAESRICAVANASGGYLAYVYDAEGNRVAKGTVNALSCDFSSNGFTTITSYAVGVGGEDLTEFDLQNGQWAWSHSDVYEGGQLLATYSANDTYFTLHDWLGTKRVVVAPDSLLSTYSSLPFGDGLTSAGNAPDVSEKHFTGKERDAESGLDYFGARYYASTMGHWMSPDWSAKAEPVPYAKLDSPQTLNLYSYVENNPITGVDVDGHYRAAWLGAGVPNVGAYQMQGGENDAADSANKNASQQQNECPVDACVTAKAPKTHWWNKAGGWFSGKVAAAGLAFVRFGRLGGPAHRAAVSRISGLLRDRGYEVTQEKYIPTPNGSKNYRFADIYAEDKSTGEVLMYQVGRTNKNGTPVAREVRALDDIQEATGIRPLFESYNSPLVTGEFAPVAPVVEPIPEDVPIDAP